MDSQLGSIGRRLALAAVGAGFLAVLATPSDASHYYRSGGYRGYAYGPSHAVYAGYHHGWGYGGGYRGGYYRAPVRYYGPPRSYFSFALSFGSPVYYAPPPPVYVYSPPPVYMTPPPVYRQPYDERSYDRGDQGHAPAPPATGLHEWERPEDSSRSPDLDVENEPPAGTYYHDPYCNKNFSTLDEYTDHFQTKNHQKTLDIIDRESGKLVRTLEFVEGYWQVKQ
jgi:hypothetical protein